MITQLQKARNEIAINQLDTTNPIMGSGRRECTKLNPMPLIASGMGKWCHPDGMIREIDCSCDCCAAYKCEACGYTWKSELPE